MATIGLTPRDVARELARRYSTMTHDELDVLESILVPLKYQKGELIIKSTTMDSAKAATDPSFRKSPMAVCLNIMTRAITSATMNNSKR